MVGAELVGVVVGDALSCSQHLLLPLGGGVAGEGSYVGEEGERWLYYVGVAVLITVYYYIMLSYGLFYVLVGQLSKVNLIDCFVIIILFIMLSSTPKGYILLFFVTIVHSSALTQCSGTYCGRPGSDL